MIYFTPILSSISTYLPNVFNQMVSYPPGNGIITLCQYKPILILVEQTSDFADIV